VAPQPVVVNDYPTLRWFAGELGQYRRELQDALRKSVGKAPKGQRYVIIMTEPMWIEMIGKPRTERRWESMRVRGLDARRNPVIGFRNLGWTMIGIYAAAQAGVTGALYFGVVSGVGGTVTVTATGTGAAGGMGGLLLRLGAKAANDNAVKIAAAAGFLLAMGVKSRSARASTDPSIDSIDLIVAIKAEDVDPAELRNLGDGSTITFQGKKHMLVGLAMVEPDQ
jgi:hypothetical protein